MTLFSSSMWTIYGTLSVLRYFKTGDQFLLWTGLRQKLTEYRDLETLTRQIESFYLKKGYIAIESKIENVKYVKMTKWSRYFNYFFRENINVRSSENGVSIFAKKHLLDSVGMTLRYDKSNG